MHKDIIDQVGGILDVVQNANTPVLVRSGGCSKVDAVSAAHNGETRPSCAAKGKARPRSVKVAHDEDVHHIFPRLEKVPNVDSVIVPHGLAAAAGPHGGAAAVHDELIARVGCHVEHKVLARSNSRGEGKGALEVNQAPGGGIGVWFACWLGRVEPGRCPYPCCLECGDGGPVRCQVGFGCECDGHCEWGECGDEQVSVLYRLITVSAWG